MHEIAISADRAARILDRHGDPNDFDPAGDYFIVVEDGVERLVMYGRDDILAVNRGTDNYVSWVSDDVR